MKALSLICVFLFDNSASVLGDRHVDLDRDWLRPTVPPYVCSWCNKVAELRQRKNYDIWELRSLINTYQGMSIKRKDDFMYSFMTVLNVCAGVKTYNENGITEDTLVHTYLHAPLHALFVDNCRLNHK
ncbi:hypothetical protein BDC45DRAFT_90671 [Circinella umbellata]|nr:hypothetical protein BDC45DRAFT_90671 [Circinella umbellata]